MWIGILNQLELALDWLLHSVACELERDEIEVIRTKIIPESVQQLRDMKKRTEELESALFRLIVTLKNPEDFNLSVEDRISNAWDILNKENIK